MQIEPPLEPLAIPPEVRINPSAENPPWSGLDLSVIGLVLVVSLFFFSSIFFIVALHGSNSAGVSATELSKNPGPLVIVPSMTLAYLVMLGAMYVLVTRHRQRPFWQAVGWRWPGNSWLAYAAAGAVLAVGLGLLSRFLPIPKSLPMDQFFKDQRGAYLMMFFGVTVAPFAEEMLFRGFLYPVLDRWFETLFMTPHQIRRGCVWLLIMAGWGFIEHRLAAGVVGAACGSGIADHSGDVCGAKPEIWRAGRPCRCCPARRWSAWGLASRSINPQAFESVTIAIVGSGLPAGTARAWRRQSRRRWREGGAGLLAVLITSAGFAMVHSEQLGQAWGPLLVLFVVGLVLTLARVVTRSVTPGFLIHVGYNLTLFTLLYLGTDHFRHLERMTQ